MSKQITTEGITLKCVLLQRDDERIITIFTHRLGVISAVVKRIGKKDYEKQTLTSSLTKGEFILIPGKTDLYRLYDGQALNTYLPLRTCLEKLRAAGLMIRVLMQSQVSGSAEELLYQTFSKYLTALTQSNNPQTLAASFFLKLLKYEGLLSPLTLCHQCHKDNIEAFDDYTLCCKRCKGRTAQLVGPEDMDTLRVLAHTKQFACLEDMILSTNAMKIVQTCMRKGGLEPPWVTPLPPQDSVSTNSTTSA